MLVTPEQLVEKIEQALTRIDEVENEHDEWVDKYVEAERTYRLEQAKAWGQVKGRSEKERLANVYELTADFARDAHRAEWMVKSSLEKVRNRRAELSAIQTTANVTKEMAQLERSTDSVF